jgi:apolipoprotein N-acyltransferase
MQQIASTLLLLAHWRRALAAFLAGCVLALTLAPLDILPAGFIAFPVLVWLLDGALGAPGAGRLARLSPAFWTGWWFGFGYFLAGLWWIGAAVLVDAENFAWALPIAVLALPGLLAVFFGCAAALARMVWPDGVGRLFSLAAAFTLFELARGVVFTGFPWNPLGATLASNAITIQLAALTGIDGAAALAVLLFSGPALFGDLRARWLGAAVPVLVGAAIIVLGLTRPVWAPVVPVRDGFTVRLVQPAVPQDVKWAEDEKTRIFADLMTLTDAPPELAGAPAPALIIWPETALPYLLEERPQMLTAIADALEPGQLLLTGGIRLEGAGEGGAARYYNSILAINDAGEVAGAADKVHLVPFGEYLPLAEWLKPLGVNPLAVAPGAFSPGAEAGSIVGPDGTRLGPLICYEAIFPGLVRAIAREADILVNVTNDAWYGRTPGPYQHFRLAQLRAVETGRPMLRAANNGLSALIDPAGQVYGGLGLDKRGISDVTLRLERADTLFARHGVRLALGLIALLAVLAMVAAALGRRRNSRSAAQGSTMEAGRAE